VGEYLMRGGAACPGFEHGEHTSDVLIRARGRTLEEAFEWAAIGAYEVITNTEKVRPRVRVEVKVSGIDEYNLLYNFIEELLYHTDVEGIVFSRLIRVCRIDKVDDGVELLAYAWGEKFDPEIHEHRTIIKAMTYAQMEIKEKDGCWEVVFVPDI
jgi:SHS2 domain-containing protein